MRGPGRRWSALALAWALGGLSHAQDANRPAPEAGVPTLELNVAQERDLDGLRGVGPAMTRRILQARSEGPFSDWADLIRRVSGVQARTAKNLSDQGLRVQGLPYPTPLEPIRP